MTGPPRQLGIEEMNVALRWESRRRGFCLCIHPFMGMIDFYGCRCQWCEQPVPENATSAELREIRTAAVLAYYPEAAARDQT